MTQVSDPDLIEKSSEAKRARREALPAVLLYASGIRAIIALVLWLSMFFGYVQLPTRFDAMSWHIREMLFGLALWIAAFLLFELIYGPMLLTRPERS